jgi:hypothetical protein
VRLACLEISHGSRLIGLTCNDATPVKRSAREAKLGRAFRSNNDENVRPAADSGAASQHHNPVLSAESQTEARQTRFVG